MEQEKIEYNVLIISLQISCTLFLCLTTVSLIDWHSPPEVWGPSDGMQSKRRTKHSAFPLNSSLQALNSIRLQSFGGKNINKNWLFFLLKLTKNYKLNGNLINCYIDLEMDFPDLIVIFSCRHWIAKLLFNNQFQ